MSTTTPEPPTRQNLAKRITCGIAHNRIHGEFASCRPIFAALIFAALAGDLT
jgi:hypothetical protein